MNWILNRKMIWKINAAVLLLLAAGAVIPARAQQATTPAILHKVGITQGNRLADSSGSRVSG